jgi:hypothetical protein
MSYKTKRTLTNLIMGVILLCIYVVLAVGKYPSEESLSAWAIFILIFIGISVVVLIITQIVFHIAFYIGTMAKEKCDDKEADRIMTSSEIEDEMDKLISLKSTRVGYVCFGFGFIATLAALALEASPIIALNVIFISFMIGTLVEGCASIYLYCRGVKNG